MEIDGQDSGNQLIHLGFQGDLLPPAARMLCQILATCACETVPAFLFVRPYLPQRRWNSEGEIEIFHAKGLPDWPNKIFQQRQESIAEAGSTSAVNRKAYFYASAIGHRFSTGDTKFYNLSQSIESLCQQGILSVRLERDDLWLQLESSTKEDLQRQTSIDDRLRLWFCLLKLVVFSYPDIYSECCWEKVQFQCQDLMDSTVSPLLAVLSWEQLSPHKYFIPHLMSFLLNYSVSRHSHLKSQSILEPSLVQDLTQHGDQMVQDTISILKFQEHFYHTIFLQLKANDSLLIHDQHVISKLFGYFAIIVVAMLDIVPEDLHSQMFPTGFDWRHLMLGETPSTIEHFAFLILSLYNLDVQDLNLDYITTSDDLELKLSLGLEMARYRRAPEASEILGLCVKEMETIGSTSSRECCIITTELVKCYNMMGEEAKAEKIALQVLGSQRDPQLKFHQDLCHLSVALADTLMGQGEYESAEISMLDVLTVDSLPRPTQTMIRLRLNKARRRLGRGEFIASVKTDFMQPILETVADLSRDLKVEVLAEISATVSLAPKQKDPAFEELTSLCHETVAALSSSHDIMGEWRIPALEQELGDLKSYTSRNKGFMDAGLRKFGLGDAYQTDPEVWNASEKEQISDLDLERPSRRAFTGMLGRLFSRRTSLPNNDESFERLRSLLNQTPLAPKPERKNFRSYLSLLGRLLPQNRHLVVELEPPEPQALDLSDGFEPKPTKVLAWREQESRDEVDISEYVSTLEVVPEREQEGQRK